MTSKTNFDGHDTAAIEEFLRAVTAPGYVGPAPDLYAVRLVRSVIAHQHSVEATTRSLGLADQAAAYLAACVKAVLPDERTADEPVATTGTAAESVRLGVEYMKANLREEVDVADIAAAGFVSVRSMQLAFRHELNTTPMAYLRHLRMHAAHAELDEATRGDGLTVTSVAIGWGFANPGRFAVTYRHIFGQSPHTTLSN
ncbi:helix-turn-helix transcriptional regulator [Nocardia sp. NPDC006044]|uniref:helix-turn-helix transcriptional regulator n=1 Tax=Nocardia sp. NPDC006044 TaxID=3364306 RepID=UPI003692E548